MLFSVSLAEKLAKQGVLSFSLHPGVIATNLGRTVENDEWADMRALDRELGHKEGWETDIQ